MSEIRVIGLDLSLTATGVATADLTFTISTSAGMPLEKRLQFIRNSVAEHATHGVEHLAVIEDFVTRSPAASTLGMVHGVVRVCLMELEVPFVLVPPATLKKYVTGKGNAKKDDMRMEVFKRFGVDYEDNNQCDAFGLRAMALDAYGNPITQLPAAQRESIEKIEWPDRWKAAA